MEDVVLSMRKGFTPSKLDQLQWIPGSGNCTWVVKSAGTEQLMMTSGSGKESKVIDMQQLNAVMKKKLKIHSKHSLQSPGPIQGSSLLKIRIICWLTV